MRSSKSGKCLVTGKSPAPDSAKVDFFRSFPAVQRDISQVFICFIAEAVFNSGDTVVVKSAK